MLLYWTLLSRHEPQKRWFPYPVLVLETCKKNLDFGQYGWCWDLHLCAVVFRKQRDIRGTVRRKDSSNQVSDKGDACGHNGYQTNRSTRVNWSTPLSCHKVRNRSCIVIAIIQTLQHRDDWNNTDQLFGVHLVVDQLVIVYSFFVNVTNAFPKGAKYTSSDWLNWSTNCASCFFFLLVCCSLSFKTEL